MFSATPRALIVYASPGDQHRLRLDKEHRALSAVLRRHGLGESRVRLLPAATLRDFVQALREESFEILQFSGHGDPNGIYLEDESNGKGSLVDAKEISAFIRDALPQLRVAIFVSCYSTDSVPELLDTAPYVITMQGRADDKAAIQFITTFYDQYFEYNVVEPSFHRAVMEVKGKLNPVLSRRRNADGAYVVHACFDKRSDSIFIDIDRARPDLQTLGIPPDEFLGLLCRKIRLHRWVFRIPRTHAPLPIGNLIGLFSWEDAEDVVICDRVMRVRADVKPDVCEMLFRLLVSYNDLCSEQYRLVPRPSDPQNERLLQRAISHAEHQVQKLLESSSDLARFSPEQFKISRASILAYLSQAETRFHSQDFEQVVIYLEHVLTSYHDLVNHLSRELTEPSRELE